MQTTRLWTSLSVFSTTMRTMGAAELLHGVEAELGTGCRGSRRKRRSYLKPVSVHARATIRGPAVLASHRGGPLPRCPHVSPWPAGFLWRSRPCRATLRLSATVSPPSYIVEGFLLHYLALLVAVAVPVASAPVMLMGAFEVGLLGHLGLFSRVCGPCVVFGDDGGRGGGCPGTVLSASMRF